MKSVIKKQLLLHYSKMEVKNILSETNKEYVNVIRRAPDIGGNKNVYLSTYLMGAYLIALYKKVRTELSLDQMNEIISLGLNDFSYMKKMMRKYDLLSSEYKQKVYKAGLWLEENRDKYPTNWLVSVKEIDNADLTHIVFERCGLYALCKNEEVPEFTSCLCMTDYITMSFANCNLERPTTLGSGDNCCDFYITRK
jgi:hypothetical protein